MSSLMFFISFFFASSFADQISRAGNAPKVVPVPVPIPVPVHHHHHYGAGPNMMPNSVNSYGQWQEPGMSPWNSQESQEIAQFDPHGLRELEMPGAMNPGYRFPFHPPMRARKTFYNGQNSDQHHHEDFRAGRPRRKPEEIQFKPDGFSDQNW